MIRQRISILFLVLSVVVSAQDRLIGETASESGRRSGRNTSFRNLARARLDVSGVNAVLVVASFDGRFDGSTDTREGLYKLTDGSSESQIVGQSLKSSGGRDKGIGALVYVFDASSSSGSVNYILKHSSSIRRPVMSSGSVVAIGLTASESLVDIPYDLKSINSPVYTSGTLNEWTPVNGLSTTGIYLASEGSIYVSASINSFSNGTGAGEWKLQYSSNQSTWTDIGFSTSQSFAISQEYAISSLSWIVEDLLAGLHYFRIAHRQTGGSAGDVRTLNSNLLACALVYEDAPGSIREFPSFALQDASSATSQTGLSPVISHSIDPFYSTDLLLQGQYTITSNATSDAAGYDLLIDQSILDANDQNQYLPSSTYIGGGGSVGLGASLVPGTRYGISLRHQAAGGTTLTTLNSTLVGFQLTSFGSCLWTGGGSSPTVWENDDNWSGAAPMDRDNALIPGALSSYPILTSSTACENLQIESGASLTLNPSSSLTVHMLLDNSGTLEVQSDDAESGSLIVTGQASGTVNYHSYLTADQWHIVSPPVYGQSISSYLQDPLNQIPRNTTHNFYGMTDYDEADNSWNSFFTASHGGSFTAGTGYLLRRESSDGSVSYTGNVIDSDLSLGIPSSGGGWNAVGNPFTSAIGVTSDASSPENFLSSNLDQLDPNYGVLYVWVEDDGYTGTQNNYRVIGNAGYTDNHGYPELNVDYIQAGQGFLVKAVSGGGILLFSEDMQTHNNGISLLKSTEESWDGFKLVAEGSNRRESVVISFHPEMTEGLDPSYDAGLLNSKPGFSIYTRLPEEDQGINFKIQCLPYPVDSVLVIPLGIDFEPGGELSLYTEGVIMPEGFSIAIEDSVLNQIVDITPDGSTYTMVVDEGGVKPGRYFLHIRVTDATGTEPEQKPTQSFYGYYHHQTITLRGKVQEGATALLYDTGGRQRGTFRLQEGDQHQIPASGLEEGLYLVSVIDGSHRHTVKIFKQEP